MYFKERESSKTAAQAYTTLQKNIAAKRMADRVDFNKRRK